MIGFESDNSHYRITLAVVVPILVLIIIVVSVLVLVVYRKFHKTVRQSKVISFTTAVRDTFACDVSQCPSLFL